MVTLTPTDFAGAVPIDGYGPGFFRLGGRVFRGPVLLHEGGAAPWGGLEDAGALAALSGRGVLLLIGTGAEIARALAALLDAAESVGLRAEVMASPAAARTYNVLLSEGRAIAAALIPV